MQLSFSVTVLVAVVATLSVLPSSEAKAKCLEGDNGPKCANCARKGTCEGVAAGGDVLLLDACPINEACTMIEGLALCKPTAETDCDCGGNPSGCDIYNPQRLNYCVENRRPIKGPICTEPEVCTPMGCMEPAITPDFCKDKSTTGYYLNPPDCSTGILCYQKMTANVLTCDAGKYFSMETENCEAYPKDPCAGCEGSCPILGDCTKYAVCKNGKLLDDETCPDGEFFNFGNQNCGNTADPPCSDCDFSLISTTSTTTTTSTTSTTTPTTTSTTTSTTTTTTPKPAICSAANVNTRYPHETNCKKYYACRRITTNSYRYIEYTCKLTYVFNPANAKCDLPENVPSCIL